MSIGLLVEKDAPLVWRGPMVYICIICLFIFLLVLHWIMFFRYISKTTDVISPLKALNVFIELEWLNSYRFQVLLRK